MSPTSEVMMSPADVARLLQDALDTQPTIIGQPKDDDLLALKEKLIDVLQTISYDRADGFHHVVGVMQMKSAYMADHTSIAFPIPKHRGLGVDKIAKDATVVEMKKAKAIHKARSEDYKIWKTAEDGCKKLICAAVEEVYINGLKDGTTFFPKVYACDLLEHLEKNSTGLHALDIVALHSNMLLLYKHAVSIPDTSSWSWKKRRRKQSAQSSPSLTSNWPCTLPPPFSNRATTRRKLTNGKDEMLP
jgi:hypothetical protein